jgi:exopolyphosphatase / guanosine-5'-triphosphate,3'-diphosphate pyrophosphatase
VKVAAVDIGTNTVRLLLADAINADGSVRLSGCERFEVVTKLGEGLDDSGVLGEAPMNRALAGLREYSHLIRDGGATAVGGVATAATRSAANGADFAAKIATTLGFAPRVIDGVEEARLTFLGATSHLDMAAVCCVIDVGGGSTEFVVGHQRPEYAVSVDIGSVLLTERIGVLGLATPAEIRDYVDELFAEVAPPAAPTLVLGCGGTFTTLAAVAVDAVPHDVERCDDITLTKDTVTTVVDRLLGMSVEEISKLPSVAAGRAEVLQSGVICAERAMIRVGAAAIRISINDILDGVAIELCASVTGRGAE